MHNIDSRQVEGKESRKLFGARRLQTAAGALAIGALAFASGGVAFSEGQALAKSQLMQTAAAAAPAVPNSPRLVPSNPHFSFADLVERVSPAVVSVQVD